MPFITTVAPAAKACKDQGDVSAIAACFRNFEGCKTLPGALDAKYGGRTPQQAQALPVCVERVSFFGLLKPQPPRLTQAPRSAEEAVVQEISPPSPARSYAVWGLLAAVVAGGGYVAYRFLRKKKKGS
jgi:hypothetical protein